MSKFKVGDRVILKVSTPYNSIGDSVVIREVRTNIDTFDDSFMYYTYYIEELPASKYLYEWHLDIDKQYYRNQKLNKLIDGYRRKNRIE